MSAQTIAADAVRGPTGYVEMDAEQVWPALMALPEVARLELARALVQAEGWRVVKVPPEWSGPGPQGDDWNYYRVGWDEHRAATLASEGGDGE